MGPGPVAPDKEALAQLRAEAASGAPGAPAAAPAAPPPDAGAAGLAAGLASAASVIGGVIAARVGVAPLTREEAAQLGEALAAVMLAYDVGPRDPRTASVFALAMVAGGIIAPRVAQYRSLPRASADAGDRQERVGEVNPGAAPGAAPSAPAGA